MSAVNAGLRAGSGTSVLPLCGRSRSRTARQEMVRATGKIDGPKNASPGHGTARAVREKYFLGSGGFSGRIFADMPSAVF